MLHDRYTIVANAGIAIVMPTSIANQALVSKRVTELTFFQAAAVARADRTHALHSQATEKPSTEAAINTANICFAPRPGRLDTATTKPTV